MPKKFPFFLQHDAMDCGPTCIRMIAKFYGKSYSLAYLRKISYADREGISMRGMAEAASTIGLENMVAQLSFYKHGPDTAGIADLPRPFIAHWQQVHFVVVYDLSKKYVWVADPAIGKIKLSHEAFLRGWATKGEMGSVMLLEPTPAFWEQPDEPINKTGFSFLVKYFRPYRQLITQLVLGVFLGSLLQLLFPFLTQAIVDIGIQNRDFGFIQLILIAQLMLFIGQLSIQYVQNWILLHVGSRINISLISDFLRKLMRLPLGFFDQKQMGDFLQRIADHRRVEQFLTFTTLRILLSSFSFIIFGAVLWYYNTFIFTIFLIGTLLYVGWVSFFLRQRRVVDQKRFRVEAENQNAIIELIQGMPEIKLQRSEHKRRWQWANIQAKLFHVNVQALSLSQNQDIGGGFINQTKNMLITFIAANTVIQGDMSLGMMLAIQYIIGQLNVPLRELVLFLRAAQDAKISLERMGEIHEMPSETTFNDFQLHSPSNQSAITINNLSFRYNPLSKDVLKNINLTIPPGKVTAIVGNSGSGKTTLIKLILGFYPPTEGEILVDQSPLSQIEPGDWRKKCGAVLQDGFIFSDSIANNIAESDDAVDRSKLLKAVKTANIQGFVESLPLGYSTKVGAAGNGLSQGQKQRLLIARAVYKNPIFLFFDEATNALDANNEKVIMENLEAFFQGKTVIVVAHRLSTVKNADQIVVLDRGGIAEIGDHQSLTEKQGQYYTLIKNQLELGQ